VEACERTELTERQSSNRFAGCPGRSRYHEFLLIQGRSQQRHPRPRRPVQPLVSPNESKDREALHPARGGTPGAVAARPGANVCGEG